MNYIKVRYYIKLCNNYDEISAFHRNIDQIDISFIKVHKEIEFLNH